MTTGTRKAAALTATQRAALAFAISPQATVRGRIYAGNGFSLPTVRRLEAEGLVEVKATITHRTTARLGNRTDLDWEAGLTVAGWTAARAL